MTLHNQARFVVLAALSLLYFLLMATTFNSLGQVLPFMVPDLHMNWSEAGFGFTLLGVACGIASLVPAMLIRRVGVSLTLLAGTALLVAGFVALAATRDVLLYNVGTTLLGLGFCLCGTVPGVYIVSNTFDRQSTALGVYFTSGSLGAVGGPIFFYLVSELTSGWRTYWLLCAAASALIGGFALIVTRDRGAIRPPEAADAPIEAPRWTVNAALRTPQLWIVIAAYTGCLLVNTTVHSFAFRHLMDHGLSKGSATALISLAALVGAASAAAAGVIGERVEPRRLTMLSLGALSLSSATLAVAHGWLDLAAFAVSMGVGLGFSYVSTAMLLNSYFGRRASLELYSVMAVVSTSAALGPGLGGMVRDYTGNFEAVFASLAAIDVVLLLLVLQMRAPSTAPKVIDGVGKARGFAP